MSEDQEELNLNELVGNLLAAHNEEADAPQLEQGSLDGLDEIPELPEQSGSQDVELGDEDLAAVVAQAIGSMEEPESQKSTEVTTEPHGDQIQELSEEKDQPQSKEEEWAQILQQGLLQESQQQPTDQLEESLNIGDGAGENLDHEDEALRRAILDSLQALNVGENQGVPTKSHDEPKAKHKSKSKDTHKDKSKGKKSKKKDAKKPTKKKSSKKKKDSLKKNKEASKSSSLARPTGDEDILNFEDVIKGFMEQGAAEPADQVTANTSGRRNAGAGDATDAETQAFVEATLRAFENELLSGTTSVPSAKTKSSQKKPLLAEDRPAVSSSQPPKSTRVPPHHLPASSSKKKSSESSSKKKKSSKGDSRRKESYNEDDFSRALAEMVNQVVNTSISDIQPRVSTQTEAPVPPQSDPSQAALEAVSNQQNIEKSETSDVVGGTQDISIHNGSQLLQEAGSFGSGSASNMFPPSGVSVGTQGGNESLGTAFSEGASLNRGPDVDLVSLTEGLDLNQIMQNAMALAFQGQSGEQINQSAVDDFNRQLGGINLSQLLDSSIGSTKTKKKAAKASKKKEATEKSSAKLQSPKKHSSKTKKRGVSNHELAAALEAGSFGIPSFTQELSKTLLSEKPEKLVSSKKSTPTPQVSERQWRKRYKAAVTEAAAKARRQRMDRNKAQRSKMKEERRIARQDKQLKKKERQEKEEAERKELEMIVAKGPPYPPDLRLTKRGRPKKPYRRYTAEEMEKRASMPLPTDAGSSKRVKKDRKKKDRKPKKIPLSALRKIPLFNFIKRQMPLGLQSRLNDIDGTLARIPLGGGREPPNREKTHPLLSSALQNHLLNSLHNAALDEKASEKHYEIETAEAQKTVIHREKCTFHPPWTIPQHPPFALPIARRKKRGDDIEGSSKKSSKDRKHKSKSKGANFVSGSKIIPASLFPIINTLKAAARARAAAGATPEEASRHLGNMLRTARMTIAQTLANARGQGNRNYSSLKNFDDIKEMQEKDRALKKIPIFSLSSIKAIKEDNKIDNSLSTEPSIPAQSKNNKVASVRNETSSSNLDGKQPNIISLPSKLVDSETLVGKEESSEQNSIAATATPLISRNNTESQALLPPETGPLQNDEDHEAVKRQSSAGSDVGNLTEKNRTEELSENAELKDAKSKELDLAPKETTSELSNPQTEITFIKTETGVQLPPKEDSSQTNLKDGFSQSGDELPAEIKNELTRAITDLITPYPKVKKRYTKTPPVLNIEGLVPPGSTPLFKSENSDIQTPGEKRETTNSASTDITTKRAYPVKQPSMVEIKYEFNLPTKNVRGEPLRAISILRRAKDYLTGEELTKLKKCITNERKRKWREANATKNKNHDLRARLKKRANAVFGEQDSAAKSEWCETEYAKRAVKVDNEPGEAPAHSSSEPTTSVSDAEVLNMIASNFNKESVSRAIEKDINNEANLILADKRPTKKRASAITKKPIKIDTETKVPANDASRAKGDLREANTKAAGELTTNEPIDPIFTQMGKRGREEGHENDASEGKRAKTKSCLGTNILKRPAYINLENK
ncbi:LAQU0S11e03950g1_1 [Lachancea quebecensis]|uniref:LAQU0S11e03950g1_1 n=1 Tax=Lachancea quebecensis TaxID=1654605 RepID=A0A0P1KU78_9SACH|nr:LAQU0S11e03950g1_1 [Lachancea quebecensis]